MAERRHLLNLLSALQDFRIDEVLQPSVTPPVVAVPNSLGNTPNRGLGTERDISLNGVPYLQSINDITNGTPVGIHFAPVRGSGRVFQEFRQIVVEPGLLDP
jgi:hypothetical protein